METRNEVAWGVQYVKDGKCSVVIDYTRHSTPQEAVAAFIDKRGGRWEDCEKEGATVVAKEIVASRK